MNDVTVRMTDIVIENFKNVTYGTLNLENHRKNYKASVLGLYGQNGSGKTALIDAVELLKFVLMGQSLPDYFADYINIDADNAHLKYCFNLKLNGNTHKVQYEFDIKKVIADASQNLSDSAEASENHKTEILNEVLSCSFAGIGKKERMYPIINTVTDEVFIPRPKYQLLIGKDKSVYTDLLVAKKLARATSRSFIFSRELLSEMRKKYSDENPEDFTVYSGIIEGLVGYGNFELFIINTTNSGLISMNAQPLAFKYEEKLRGAVGTLMLPLEKPEVVPQEALEVVKKIIGDMNIVLEQIVPGLTIGVRELGTMLMKNNKPGERIQLVSCKNSKEIPLRYESEGIKKIISVLQLLIVVYNQPSITVAIDELDAGVFEYLLGELLKIISEKGKGQLIFTSHNLRPLETLDKGFIAFTTTNPSNRYIRLSNVKETNNLRDFYFRDIVLGEQSEEVYNPTNNAEIALAFREAGEISGS